MVKGPVWVRFLAPETHMNLDTEVRGPYCQLGLGLCVDAFLYWNSAAEDGIQPLDVLVLDPHAKETFFKKGSEKWTPLKSKVVTPGGSSFGSLFATFILVLFLVCVFLLAS